MLTKEGQVRIMDFGLAQLAEGSKLTKNADVARDPGLHVSGADPVQPY